MKRHVPTFFEILFTLLVLMLALPVAVLTAVIITPLAALRSITVLWRHRP